MDKIFWRMMSLLSFLAIVVLAYKSIEVHRAVYGILWGVIFQASSGDILQAIKLWRGLWEK